MGHALPSREHQARVVGGHTLGPSLSGRSRYSLHSATAGSTRVALRAGENVIGRDPDALIRVASPGVSRRHARILVAGERAMLEDLGSKNGTYLGEQRMASPTQLKNGDRIGVGPVLLIFRISSAETASADQGG